MPMMVTVRTAVAQAAICTVQRGVAGGHDDGEQPYTAVASVLAGREGLAAEVADGQAWPAAARSVSDLTAWGQGRSRHRPAEKGERSGAGGVPPEPQCADGQAQGDETAELPDVVMIRMAVVSHGSRARHNQAEDGLVERNSSRRPRRRPGPARPAPIRRHQGSQ